MASNTMCERVILRYDGQHLHLFCLPGRGCRVCLLFVNLEYPLQKILIPSPSWLRNQLAFYWCSYSGWFSFESPDWNHSVQQNINGTAPKEAPGKAVEAAIFFQVFIRFCEVKCNLMVYILLDFFHPICAVEFIQSPACRGRVYIWWSPQCKTNHPMNLYKGAFYIIPY